MGEHTKTPWEFRVYSGGCTIVSTHDRPGSSVRDSLKGVHIIVDAQINDDQSNVHEASPDAAFIVRAVNSHEALVHALGPYTSGGEWGKWLAWLVEGAPTREEGIAAAKIIVNCQVHADDVLAQAQRGEQA